MCDLGVRSRGQEQVHRAALIGLQVTERYPAQFLDRSYLVDCLRNDREQSSRPRVKQQWLIAVDQELVEHEVRFGDVDRNPVNP